MMSAGSGQVAALFAVWRLERETMVVLIEDPAPPVGPDFYLPPLQYGGPLPQAFLVITLCSVH